MKVEPIIVKGGCNGWHESIHPKAKRVLSHAQSEAERMGKQTIGTEHLLLGLMIEEGTIANRVLKDLGLDLSTLRTKVEEETGLGSGGGSLTLGKDTQETLELALEEAREGGQSTVGTEHLLLALSRDLDFTGMKILTALGITPQQIRRQTFRVISQSRQNPEDENNAPLQAPPERTSSQLTVGRASSRKEKKKKKARRRW